MTHEAASENGDDARQFLQRLKDHSLKVTAAFSDYSQSSLKPQKRSILRPAFSDHFHTVKNIWGTSKNRCSPTAEELKAHGEHTMYGRSWNERRRYGSCVGASSRRPANLSLEEKQALAALESEDGGFVAELPTHHSPASEYLRPYAQ